MRVVKRGIGLATTDCLDAYLSHERELQDVLEPNATLERER